MAPPADPRTDAELIRAHRRGDRQAFAVLIGRHLGLTHAIAHSALRNREAAEDVAQEAILRALLALDSLDEPARFSAWLAQITRNLGVNWLKQGQRRSRLVPLVVLGEQVSDVPDTSAKGARALMHDREREIAVREALWQLPPDEREVVMLHCVEGMSQTQIADRLGIHKSTVSRQIKRALGALRGSVEESLRDHAPRLRMRREATARTFALVAAAVALSPAAKAALAAKAGLVTAAAMGSAPAAAATVGVLSQIKAALTAGGSIMAIGKGIPATLGVAAILSTGVYLTGAAGDFTGSGDATAAAPKGQVSDEREEPSPALSDQERQDLEREADRISREIEQQASELGHLIGELEAEIERVVEEAERQIEAEFAQFDREMESQFERLAMISVRLSQELAADQSFDFDFNSDTDLDFDMDFDFDFENEINGMSESVREELARRLARVHVRANEERAEERAERAAERRVAREQAVELDTND